MEAKPHHSMVAALNSFEVTAAVREACLREEELQEAAAMKNAVRRGEWLAGRVAAKYAFLCAENSGGAADVGTLYVQEVTRLDLAVFSPERYRSVCVVRDNAPGGGPARVGWSADSERLCVAISHSAGMACACLSGTGIDSLDIETPAARVPAFYQQTFSQGEREWVRACVSSYSLPSDWLYTLLWSARECLLKIPRFSSFSLWNMPLLAIDIAQGADRLRGIHAAQNLYGGVEILEASTSRESFRLAVAGTPNLILTAIAGLG